LPPIVTSLFSLFGFLLRALGFLALGLVLGRFVFDSFKTAVWQVQVALVLGFFGLLVGITDFATAGSAGTFAIGAAAAYFAKLPPSKIGDSAVEK
jgi:hypothetical protein